MDPLNTIRLEINGAAQTQGPGKCHHACTKAPTLPRDVYPSLLVLRERPDLDEEARESHLPGHPCRGQQGARVSCLLGENALGDTQECLSHHAIPGLQPSPGPRDTVTQLSMPPFRGQPPPLFAASRHLRNEETCECLPF